MTELIRRVTTIVIVYHMPDHPRLLQEFMWQTLDVPPQFPRMRSFMRHWHQEVHAVIARAELSVAGIYKPFELRIAREVGSC